MNRKNSVIPAAPNPAAAKTNGAATTAVAPAPTPTAAAAIAVFLSKNLKISFR